MSEVEEVQANLPTVITPEGLAVADAYLNNGSDSKAAADALGMPVAEVNKWLNKKEVRSYIDDLFFEVGFRNRDKIFGVMDAVLEQKLDELDETDMGSGKDVLEIIQALHKMRMDEMNMRIKLAALENASDAKSIRTQNNIQINGSEGYNSLVTKLMKDSNRK